MIVSIDIGTSYSSICRMDPNGKAQPVDIGTGASMFGSKYSLPTAVFVEEDGRLLVGQAAMNRRKSNPQNFRMEFKRNLGEDIPIVLGGRNFRPEDLYTELFRHMKECAERESGEPVELSYLTYPASYGEGRKDRIRAAAKAAGLFEVELVDEPTAAAMCYCAEGYIEDGQTLLVYDFGGGTFDVSVLRYEGGAFRLLSEPGGLERCGGIDMDRLIFQDMMSRVDADILESLKARQRNYMHFVNQLGELAVKAKHHLRAAQVFDEEIEIGFDMVPYRLTVERFNEMIAPLVGGTIQACRQTLEEAGVDASELSAILMMGGTSRVPLVQNMAQGISRTARLLYSVNLELAVAQGALRYRNNIDNQHNKNDSHNSDNKNNSSARSAEEWLHMGDEAGKHDEWTDAVSCYQKAVELGSAEAMIGLGYCYERGEGVEKDEGQAVHWYRKAAEQGNAKGMNWLGDRYKLGWGVEKDEGQAVHWYRKAAEQGNAEGMYYLGDCYVYGHGVKKDIGQAIDWYKRAAELGYATAMNQLGECYGIGEYIERDMDQAIYWYRKAAKLGDLWAMNHLGECYEYGWGVEKDKGRAMEWYRKVEEGLEERGSLYSWFSFGFNYERGLRGLKDKSKAIYWYQKAADLGHEYAKERLREIELED